MKNLFFLCLALIALATLTISTESDARDFISPSIMNTGEELKHLYDVKRSTNTSTQRALRQLQTSGYTNFQREFKAHEIVDIAARESTPHEEQFKGDAHAARAHALMWYITRDKAHLMKSADIIRAWAYAFRDFKVIKGYKPQMYLESAWILPIWISALDMIKPDLTDWSKQDEQHFRNFIKKLHSYAKKAHRDNNWGVSAMLAEISVAVYFESATLYNEQLNKFSYYLKTLSNEDGSLNADYLSDPWHPQYSLIGFIQTAEIASNQGDNLFEVVIGDEEAPRLEKILIHFEGLFSGKKRNPEGLQKGSYKGAHNNKQSYQIALAKYSENSSEKEWIKSFRQNWKPSNTSPLFMMWDRITHSREVINKD